MYMKAYWIIQLTYLENADMRGEEIRSSLNIMYYRDKCFQGVGQNQFGILGEITCIRDVSIYHSVNIARVHQTFINMCKNIHNI